MLKAKVNIQVLKVVRRLITLFKPFFRGKEIYSFEMSIFFKILVRIASNGPQIDQSHGENRLSHIIVWENLPWIIHWIHIEIIHIEIIIFPNYNWWLIIDCFGHPNYFDDSFMKSQSISPLREWFSSLVVLS